MSTATLIVTADTSGLVAAFSDATKAAAAAEKAIVKGAEDASKKAADSYRKSQRAFVSAQRSMVVEAQRAVAAEVKAEQQRARAARMSADARKKAETEATRVAREEAQKRGLSAEQEARVKQNALEKYTRLYETEERRQTAATEREAAKRRQAMQRSFNEWRSYRVQEGRQGEANVGRMASAAGGAVSGAVGVAGNAIGMIREARATRATAERSVGGALYQAGGSRADVVRSMGTITRFAQAERIPTEDIAAALNASQTEFSTLGNASTSSAERDTRLASFLQTVELARSTGNDVSEFGRLSGLFQSQGFDPALQRQLLLYSAGAAQRGAVEVGSITRQSMPAITARMGTAMARARTEGRDPQQAAVAEYREALAELEVARGTQGSTPRLAGQAMQSITQRLGGTVTQDNLRTNIRTSLGANSALERQLYEADPARSGQMRLRSQYTNAIDLVGAFGAQGLTSQQFMNITGGGGHGNPLSMLANERRTLGGLLNADAQGETGIAKVLALRDPSSALTEADVTRGRDLFKGDEQSRLAGLEETRLNALTNNSASVDRLTESIDRLNASNPLLAMAAPVAGAGLAGLLGAKITAGIGAGAVVGGGMFANARSVITGEDATGRKLGGVERWRRALSMSGGGAAIGGFADALTGTDAGGRDLSWSERIQRAVTAPLSALNPLPGMGGSATGAADIGRLVASDQGQSVLNSLPERITAALRGATFTATISPTDAAQAASTAPVPSPPAR